MRRRLYPEASRLASLHCQTNKKRLGTRAGLSPATFALICSSCVCSVAYSKQKGFALSTYVESVTVGLQTAALAFCCARVAGVGASGDSARLGARIDGSTRLGGRQPTE